MSRRSKLSRADVDTIRDARNGGASFRSAGALVGVSATTAMRALSKTREANEFKGSSIKITPLRRDRSAFAWSLSAIRAARDEQLLGIFRVPVRLAEALRTDDALFSAYHNRVAPHNAIEAHMVPCNGTRGASVARRAAQSITCARSVLGGILGTMANHGVAIGYNEQTPNAEGTRIDFRVKEWPLEHVRYNPTTETLETLTRNGPIEPITHGDGRWIVFRKFDVLPWTQEACVLPAALLWAAHANGVKDWAQASTSHGQAKIIGELPEGVALRTATGLSPEAQAFIDMLQSIVSGDAGSGLRPFGSKTDFLANGSTAWQVFKELIENREKAAARIYLGTDAMLGSVGGAPGVDIATLFGVATTKVQGDFEAIEQALLSGLYEPWTAINYGDSTYAPALEYRMPDPDAETDREQLAKRQAAFHAEIKARRENGFTVDQATVDELAERLRVPAPRLPLSTETKASPAAPPAS